MKNNRSIYLFMMVMLAFLSLGLGACQDKKEDEKNSPAPATESSEDQTKDDENKKDDKKDDEDDSDRVTVGCFDQISQIIKIVDPNFDLSAEIDEAVEKNIDKLDDKYKGLINKTTLAAFKLLLSAQPCDKFLETIGDALKNKDNSED